MPVGVSVDVITVTVGMRVDASVGSAPRGDHRRHPLRESGQAQDSQQDQHQGDGELHRETDAGRDHHAKDDDHPTHQGDGDGVADAPQAPDQGGAPGGPLPAHDRGDGNDVVGIHRVPHPEEQPQEDDGKVGDRGGFLSAPPGALVLR